MNDVSELPDSGSFAEAAIEFDVSTATAGKISVYGLHPMQTAKDWNESMTWKSKFISLSDSIDSVELAATDKICIFNITDYVKAMKNANATTVGF